MTAADALVALLERWDVEHVFGFPSEQMEAYYASLADSDVRHVLARSEASAALMADGYARTGGGVGVCDGVGGPGAAFIAVGLAEAAGASSPVVALTGDNARDIRGREVIQDADNAAIMAPHVTTSLEPDGPDRVVEAVANALREATTGVPGPMHVNLPEDVLAGDPEADGPSGSPGRTPAPPAPDGATVAAVAEHLVDADRPVLLCGEGAVRAGAFEPVRRLARAADAPVVTSMNGKGVVDETADYAAGVAGRWGYCEVANGLLADADLVVGLGCRFGDLTTVGGSQPSAGATVVHVDLDPHWLGRTVDVDVPVLADVRATADRLASALEERPVGPGDRLEAVADRYATWRSSFASLLESDASPIAPHRIVDELHRATPPSTILVSSTSFPGFFTAAFYQVREPGARYLQARGSDGINCALPQAIGAQLANPDVPVVAVTGDGGLGYHVADLETAARVGAPITVIVFDNQSLGSSKASMLANQGVALSTDFHPEVDYATVAEGFGCTGIAVDEPEAFAAALADAVGADEPTLIDAHIDPNAIPPVLV